MKLLSNWAVSSVLSVVIGLTSLASASLLGLPPELTYLVGLGPILAFLLGWEFMVNEGSLKASVLRFTHFSVMHLVWGLALTIAMLATIAVVGSTIGGEFSEVANARFNPNMLLLIVLAATVEELVFRGVVFVALRKRFGGFVAVSVTSILFGLAHMTNQNVSFVAIMNVVFAGVLLSVALLKSYTLWTSLSFHIVWNTFVAVFFGSVSGSDLLSGLYVFSAPGTNSTFQWLIGGGFGIEEGILTTFCLLLGTGLTFLYIKEDVFVKSAQLRQLYGSVDNTSL